MSGQSFRLLTILVRKFKKGWGRITFPSFFNFSVLGNREQRKNPEIIFLLLLIMKRWNIGLEQLLKQDPIAMGMLGKQMIHEQRYRPLTYVLTTEEEDKRIYFNLLTHEMIAINFSELDLLETRKYLVENWYLVPEQHDDQLLVDECRAVLTLMDSWPRKIHVFHIFTTLNCNARCFYCYEKRIPGSNMTMETAARVVEYMKEQAEDDTIELVWFGGEPLFNYPIIDFITDGLREKGLKFHSFMYSNGFLFDNAMVEKAKNLWNLGKVQITLDGTSQVYKKVKAYVTDVQDPFERVLQNIRSLLKAEIRVLIRLNIGMYNYLDIRDLVDYLCVNFGEEDSLKIYVTPLFESIKYADEKKEFIYDIVKELNGKLNRIFGKNKNKGFSRRIANGSCMASGREAVTILPDGKVGICNGMTYDVILGDIYTTKIDVKVREKFGRRFYREDKCRFCPVYPDCHIVSGCPIKDDNEGCEPVIVQMKIKEIIEKMKLRCRLGASEDEKGLT